jgi:hypothetical protein
MPADESEHDRRITAREGPVSGAWRANSSAGAHETALILANLPIFRGLEPFEARADAPDSSIGAFRGCKPEPPKFPSWAGKPALVRVDAKQLFSGSDAAKPKTA